MSIEKRSIVVLLMMYLFSACDTPTEDIKLVVDTDILKYTALVYVTDGSNGGPAPANASIRVLGEEADNVYEISGKKDIKLSAGTVTIGLGPSVAPQPGVPITVDVEISAPGFRTVVREVTFTAEQRQQTVSISLMRTGSTAPPVVPPPPAVQNTEVSLNFTGRCRSRTDLEVRPSVYVFFRETGSNTAFQYLGYMDKGQITSNFLSMGKTYDFQIVFGGEVYQVNQKIEQSNYNLTIDMDAACIL